MSEKPPTSSVSIWLIPNVSLSGGSMSHANGYRELFEQIKIEFVLWIYAYYYEILFEETLVRHQTKPNYDEFGEEEMKYWWNEKDYIGIIPEKIITKDFSLDRTVDMIFHDVMND